MQYFNRAVCQLISEQQRELREKPQRQVAFHELRCCRDTALFRHEDHPAQSVAERRSFGKDDLDQGEQAEEGPVIKRSVNYVVNGFRQQNSEPAGQHTKQKIAAHIVEQNAPDPAHSRDFAALGAAACINLVAARQNHHKHIGDLPANSSSHGIADQIFNISKPVRARINAEQRGELARFIEQAQQK